MKRLNTEIGRVFSAYAEVVPKSDIPFLAGNGILRVRGGSSGAWSSMERTMVYSPRTRR